jgi:hypothetical protein
VPSPPSPGRFEDTAVLTIEGADNANDAAHSANDKLENIDYELTSKSCA